VAVVVPLRAARLATVVLQEKQRVQEITVLITVQVAAVLMARRLLVVRARLVLCT
jgi:hypothetical protein